MNTKNKINGFRRGNRVRLVGDFVNGKRKVVAKDGQEGTFVRRQSGSSVCEVRISGLEHPIFPLGSKLVLA